jgi:hypothetical protein
MLPSPQGSSGRVKPSIPAANSITENPFGHVVNGIDRWFGHNPATDRSDVKQKNPYRLLD